MLRFWLVGVLFLGGWSASAHDSWINQGGYRNTAGEWCCGEGDCFEQHGVQNVTLPTVGYRLPSGEFVPLNETQPSPDGKFWRCKRPDGTRRCFFRPYPGRYLIWN